jgi:hypothetical protein
VRVRLEVRRVAQRLGRVTIEGQGPGGFRSGDEWCEHVFDHAVNVPDRNRRVGVRDQRTPLPAARGDAP